ncbi:NAD(P)-bd-dom domain-containing protein [Mycena venus]|uniref:Superoxide dismutase [Cu-Zn] n=1 Tax=Mycena venus TaxID=2733690 RepID=A0A8H6YTZ1_9AGAR|nr:NAD(P)-bd-dom domain-containing protein [Mycena venus]
MAPLNILSVGGSRNIGYLSAIRLLEQGSTVTFLLRSPSTFDGDATIQKYVKSGHARLVKGDATIEADTQRAWDQAGIVDAVVFTVGAYPSFSITKGLVQMPHDLCTQCILNVLCTMPTYANAPQPKLVVLSSTGLGPAAHKALPLALKPLYSMIISIPHRDKIGMERAIAHCAGWSWDHKTDGKVPADILREGWTERKGLPARGNLRHALVIRAGLLTDGDCVADKVAGTRKKSYRVSEKELGGYTISRKDVAHLIVDALTRRWNEFDNKRAVAVLKGDSQATGTVTFEQQKSGVVTVKGELRNLSPSASRGFHIHQSGDLTDGCLSAGPHFNPFSKNHGAPSDTERHVGDLGNIKTDEAGTASFEFEDSLISLNGPLSIVGRAVVLHAGTDDLGRGNNPESLKTGNAGARAACGVIGLV